MGTRFELVESWIGGNQSKVHLISTANALFNHEAEAGFVTRFFFLEDDRLGDKDLSVLLLAIVLLIHSGIHTTTNNITSCTRTRRRRRIRRSGE